MAVIDFYCLLCMFSLLPATLYFSYARSIVYFTFCTVPIPTAFKCFACTFVACFFSRNTEILQISYATTTSRFIHQYHRRRRVAGEGRGFVARPQHDSTPPEVSKRMGGIVSPFIQQ